MCTSSPRIPSSYLSCLEPRGSATRSHPRLETTNTSCTSVSLHTQVHHVPSLEALRFGRILASDHTIYAQVSYIHTSASL